ncbi:MAG TPA: non-homologous end-joining DNA ligase [Blastocatellia bacterium]|jgi:bifunctional non-homologous end joining protein LigD|nr:non-homologous end-joining DNA ligase [Blastocatellia bacterium]
MGLEEYKGKRNFKKTREPEGAKVKQTGQRRFMIHEHHASILHFDFRMEIDEVAKSWSIPRGPSMNPKDRRLAVQVEDHPVEYMKFEGEIPEGEYGAGLSLIWDSGTFDAEGDPARGWDEGSLEFTLRGDKLKGGFVLFRMKGRERNGKPQWLLVKKKDEFADEGWELVQRDPRGAISKRRAARDHERRVTRTKARADEAISGAAFLRKREIEGDLTLKVGRKALEVTSLDKVYWPDEGYTKGDLLRYYLEVGKYIVPYLKDRPSILKRYPNGISGQMFFQHNVESAPDVLRTERLESETGRMLNYGVYTDLASLIYLVNIGTVEQHPWHSRVSNLDRPDYVVFDLDPHGAPFANVLQVALAMRDVLKSLKLTGYPKTSGSSGIHIYVPVRPRYEYQEVADFSEQVSIRVAEQLPKIATVERKIAERKKDQIYVDWQQNARGKSAASVYTVRAKPGATVSTPVTWQEISRGIEIADFTIESVPPRLKKKGDLWKEMMKDRQSLPKLKRER